MLAKKIVVFTLFAYVSISAMEYKEEILRHLAKRQKYTHSMPNRDIGHVANLEDKKEKQTNIMKNITESMYIAAYEFMFGSYPDDETLDNPIEFSAQRGS